MTTPKTSYLLLPAGLALGLLGAGCHVSHAEYVGTGTPGPSTIVVPEVEVNDFAFAPQHVGTVFPGDHLFIEGSITDAGWDPRDGFQLFAAVPMVVNVVLNAHVPGVDLDWCVWDPTVGDYTVCAETEFNPELGSFIVLPPGNEFHMVVSSFSGTSTYTLELTFSAYYGAEAAPSDRTLDEEEKLRPTPRAIDAAEYGENRTWMVPSPFEPLVSGSLFAFYEDRVEQTDFELIVD
jgi:hypothetical protein